MEKTSEQTEGRQVWHKPYSYTLANGKEINVKGHFETVGGVPSGKARSGAVKPLQIIRREPLEGSAEGVVGVYNTLMVDVPWDAAKGGIGGKVYPPFPMLSHQEVLDFPIDSFATEQCHLYLWCLNSTVELAYRVLDAWGFKYHCLMTWVKTGGLHVSMFSFTSEFVMFGYRGYLRQNPTDGKPATKTWFEGKKREYARKPDELYATAERISLPPRVDIFAREARKGWDVWGNEAGGNGYKRGELVRGFPIWKEGGQNAKREDSVLPNL